MSEAKLGSLIGPQEQRDAIHVAIAPVIAGGHLAPGWHIGLDSEGKASINATKIGIVDPFLTEGIEVGQRFYMVLYPNTVTGMRHHWSHPSFTDNDSVSTNQKEASLAWMREFASQHYSDSDNYSGFGGFYTAEMLIEHASDYLQTGDKHIQQGSESLRADLWNERARREFWKHFSVITGMIVADNMEDMVPFCCTC